MNCQYLPVYIDDFSRRFFPPLYDENLLRKIVQILVEIYIGINRFCAISGIRNCIDTEPIP